MKKNYFMPNAIGERVLWLNNFAAKLPMYIGKYGIDSADMNNQIDGAASYAYWVQYRNQYQEYQKKLTQFLIELSSGTANQSVMPTPPATPPPVAEVAPGVITRALYWANRIKNHSTYTEADGQDLGLEGVQVASRPSESTKPVISLRMAAAGHPEIVWSKQEMDALEIWKAAGDGAFALLDIDLMPNYTDTTTLPPVVTTWRYKAIYRKDSAQFGQWGDVVSINVGG